VKRRARTIAVIVAGLVLAGAAAIGAVWALNATQVKAASAHTDASSAGTTTVAVARRDVVSRIRVNGTLGYGASQPVISHSEGTITAMAAEGTVVQRGQTLYEVDGHPVVLFYGDRPAWRTLSIGVSDGPDVTQLQRNLIALGYATTSNLSADGHFGWSTVAAVERWQKAMGLSQTGTVELGQVVFLPGAIRVGSHQAQVGGPAGGVIMNVSSTTRVVTVDLDASRQTLVKVGDAVQVIMPNTGATTTGTVTDIAKVAKTSGGGNGGGSTTTVTLTISLTDPAATGSLDQAPVRVAITTQSAKNVLAVPVNALLALADGSYAVEIDSGGRRRVVPVQTGLFDEDGGIVEISGTDITAGTRVLVPQ
jgi:peptidoglycan hydrolase-like protein with peptidoglycan-binding domain